VVAVDAHAFGVVAATLVRAADLLPVLAIFITNFFVPLCLCFGYASLLVLTRIFMVLNLGGHAARVIFATVMRCQRIFNLGATELEVRNLHRLSKFQINELLEAVQLLTVKCRKNEFFFLERNLLVDLGLLVGEASVVDLQVRKDATLLKVGVDGLLDSLDVELGEESGLAGLI